MIDSIHMKGSIELFDIRDNVWGDPILKQSNLITFQGSDVAARALAGNIKVDGMYLCFENNTTTSYVAQQTNNAGYYQTEIADRGLVRIPTIAVPEYSKSSDDYVNNKVIFTAVTDGTSFGTESVSTGSVFKHAALVSLADDAVNDLIFSCTDLASDIPKIAGAQIGIKWTINFTS